MDSGCLILITGSAALVTVLAQIECMDMAFWSSWEIMSRTISDRDRDKLTGYKKDFMATFYGCIPTTLVGR